MPHADPDASRAYHKARRERLEEHIKAVKKAYYLKNRSLIRARSAKHYAKNKETINKRTRELRALNREAHREANMKCLYGIDRATFMKMLMAQSGLCAICRSPETARYVDGTIKRLSIDHDHITNRVRGLLCAACNHMLGKARDSVAVLTRAIEYLSEARDVV